MSRAHPLLGVDVAVVPADGLLDPVRAHLPERDLLRLGARPGPGARAGAGGDRGGPGAGKAAGGVAGGGGVRAPAGIAEIIDELCPVRPVAWISHGEVIEALVANRLTAPAPMVRVQERASAMAVDEAYGI